MILIVKIILAHIIETLYYNQKVGSKSKKKKKERHGNYMGML